RPAARGRASQLTRIGPCLGFSGPHLPADRHKQQPSHKKRCEQHNRVMYCSVRANQPRIACHGCINAHRHRSDAARRCSAEVTKLTTISAIPTPSLSRSGFRSPSHTASGGQKIRASLTASRQASTPERNIPAIAPRRFFSGVIELDPSSGLCEDSRLRLSAGRSPRCYEAIPVELRSTDSRWRLSPHSLLERVNPRNALPDDE